MLLCKKVIVTATSKKHFAIKFQLHLSAKAPPELLRFEMSIVTVFVSTDENVNSERRFDKGTNILELKVS